MTSRSKNILITGATSGIGEALALHYAKSEAKNLFICGRNEQRLQTVTLKCQKLGAAVFSRIIDVTDRQAMKQWINECCQKAPLNLVIANAGISSVDNDIDSTYQTFETNITGVLNTIAPVLENYQNRNKEKKGGQSSLDDFIARTKQKKKAFHLSLWDKLHLARSGNEFFHTEDKAVAIVSSMAGYHGLATCPAYSASKACVKAWGEALRVRLKPQKINVSVICPGFVRSRITDKNTCPMPFFMEADKAAEIIARGLAKNKGIIAFPWPMRFVVWFMSILPNCISDRIYGKLPDKA